jgi:sterol desaturase/sphingolipid hydroxylase (fatty acid hydroxylase superfamily)
MENITAAMLSIFGRSVIRYFVLAGIPFLLFYILLPVKFQGHKIQKRRAGRKDFLREVWHSMQSTVVFSLIAGALLYTPLKHYTLIYDQLHYFPIWYLWVSIGLSLVIHDTYFYWMHRLLHHKKLFRLAHVVHHQSTNPSPWTAYSFHLLEAVTEGAVLILITLVLPMHPLAILGFNIAAFIINVYGHLGYEIVPRWLRRTWLFEVINTSVHHNLHHSKFKGNYGLYFRTWDRLMGTEHPDYVKEFDRVQAQRKERVNPPSLTPPYSLPGQ